jgi:hypothetical protein
MARKQIKEETHSNNHKFLDLPIQITSILVDVTTNPNHTQKATAMPLVALPTVL